VSIESYPNPNGVLTSLIWRKTMSGAETSLSGYDNASQALSYTPGQEQVYLNGILLVRGDDYTATNGTSITGLSALAASDYVQVNCYNNFSVASVPAASLTGTVTNAQLANSAITINGSAISLGGTVTLAGDIESVTATSPLTGGGSTGALTVGIQDSSTAQKGSVQLSDSTSTTSSILAATPTAVKSAYDLANGAIPKTLTTTTGDIIYASAANTPARLGIGSSAQILTVASGIPSWSLGGMTLISTTSFSGATTANVDNLFSSTYTSYKVLLSRWNTSGNTCIFKLRYGSNTQSTNYYGVATGINSNGTSQSTLSSAATGFGAGFDNQTGSGVLELTFTDVGTSAIQPMWCGTWNGHANYIQLVGGQINANWQTYTGIQFLSASGNVSGTVSVYGLAR